MNRRLELLYRETEWLNVLHTLKQQSMDSYPAKDLTEGWKIILRNQFHDIIPGSSIMEVYEDAYKEYMEALKIGEDIWSEAAKTIVNNESDNIWTVFNSALWERNDLVYISDIDYRVGMWHDHLGNTLKAQKVNEGWYVQVNNIPSMGYAHIQFVPHDEQVKEVASDIFKYSNQSMMTPFYSIT